ncbi:MAG: glycosyltransferase [Candidatus Dojkabacteria bacterium]|nr:glycosyltransferase [Candidatus Dojkabacteria bacterium]
MKKILILTPYSKPSACGIWQVAFNNAVSLKKAGNIVEIFSSNILKGTKEKLTKNDEFEDIKVKRFKVWFKLGGTSMFWFPILSIIKTKPAIIHTHGYRHPHSLQALIIGKLLRKKVLLTTHGPFDKDSRRSIFLKFMDKTYDILIGWWELKLYDKVIRVADWEKPYLKKLLVSEGKQVTIPNSIDDKFFENSKVNSSRTNRVFFMGRVDTVKET